MPNFVEHAETEAQLSRLTVQRNEAWDLLAELVDPDDCAIDSHGYCEAHGYVTKSRCPHARAKVLLGLTETAADHGPLTEVLSPMATDRGPINGLNFEMDHARCVRAASR